MRATITGALGASIWACPRRRSRALPRVGSVVIKTEDEPTTCARSARADGRARHPVRGLGRGAAARELPFYDPQRFAPPRRPDDPAFGDSDGEIAGAVLFPTCGYVNDPQLAARNLQQAAEAQARRFRFNAKVAAIRRERGRVAGVTLADGTTHRRAGGGQRRRPAFLGRSTAWPGSRPRWRYARGPCARRLPTCRHPPGWISERAG